MDANNELNFDDPLFGKVLKTYLEVEIETAKKKMDATVTKMNKQYAAIRAELDKRKQLKKEVMLMSKNKAILSETLKDLYQNITEVSDNLEVLKANADPEYKLIQLQAQEYQGIIAEYKQTWQDYHATYEEFPLAKARKTAKIEYEQLKVEHMALTCKKENIMQVIKMKQRIDWIRTRNKIIEFAAVMVEHMKLRKELTEFRMSMNYHKKELRSVEMELQVLRKEEEDQKKLREQKMLEMAPPKINIPYRGIYTQNRTPKRYQNQWRQITEYFDDDISVDTLALEELCIKKSPDRIDVEVEWKREKNPNFTAVREENIAHFESTAFSEKPKKTCAASIASDVEENGEKMVFSSGAIEIVEIEEIQEEIQETVKAQPSFRTKENSLKHSAPNNLQNELEAKRIRLEIEAKDSKMDLSPPPSLPKITSIQSVRYNIMPITSKSSLVQCANKEWDTSSVFSSASSHHKYCESEMSFGQISKGSSLYDGSLCNFNLSQTSNISEYIDKDTKTSPPIRTLQKNKKQAADKHNH